MRNLILSFLLLVASVCALGNNRLFARHLQDPQHRVKSTDGVNRDMSESLRALLATKYFRLFKANLHKGCSFWKEDFFCVQKDCSVETIDDEVLLSKTFYYGFTDAISPISL